MSVRLPARICQKPRDQSPASVWCTLLVAVARLSSGRFRRCCASFSVVNAYCVIIIIIQYILQCFDAVGWTAGRASGL